MKAGKFIKSYLIGADSSWLSYRSYWVSDLIIGNREMGNWLTKLVQTYREVTLQWWMWCTSFWLQILGEGRKEREKVSRNRRQRVDARWNGHARTLWITHRVCTPHTTQCTLMCVLPDDQLIYRHRSFITGKTDPPLADNDKGER